MEIPSYLERQLELVQSELEMLEAHVLHKNAEIHSLKNAEAALTKALELEEREDEQAG